MKIQQYGESKLVFYHSVTTGDTIDITFNYVKDDVSKTVTPTIEQISSTFFIATITGVTGSTLEDLTGGTIYFSTSSYYDYDLKVDAVSVEQSQVFVIGPPSTVVVAEQNNAVIITEFGSGSSGSSGATGTNGISGTSGITGSSGSSGGTGATGSSGSSGATGTSGISGTSGVNGTSGVSGSSGSSASSGLTGSSGTSGSSGASGISAGQVYYFNQSQSSDVSPYKVLATVPSTSAQQTVTKTLTNNQQNVLVQQFITPELGFSVIPGGVQRFHTHNLKQASNDDVDIYITIQLADSSGTGIGPILSTGTSLIGWVGSSIPVETTVDLTLPTTTIDPTNRMIVKIYYNNNDSSSHNVTWYTEGTSYYSFVMTTVGAVAGSSGSSGSSGMVGVSRFTNVTLPQTGFTYNTGTTYYECTYTNANITTNTNVDFIPYNSSVSIATQAAVFPYIQPASGSAKITSQYIPMGDITGEVYITIIP